MGFEDAPLDVTGEYRQNPAFIRGRSRELAEQALEDPGLFVQEIDEPVEVLVDGSCAGQDANRGLVIEAEVVHGAAEHAWVGICSTDCRN
ncbi:MAG: hypothetical protein H0W83_09880 [Planctomycetes bacterium]|nr:hypothetical protein [Planctomycetota bacterium]